MNFAHCLLLYLLQRKVGAPFFALHKFHFLYLRTKLVQDYYATLGLLPSAELAVIKGAYKAMMSIYHPDKYEGDKDFAHKKTLAIQEAYEILRDPFKRASYDESLSERQYYTEDSQEAKASDDEVLRANSAHWEYALKYHPELSYLEHELSILSPNLAMQFRLNILDSKNFSKSIYLRDQLKQEYLERFFGKDILIKDFACELLINNHRDAAKELNKAVNFLGNDVNPKKLIASIKKEFGIKTKVNFSHANHSQENPWGNNSQKTPPYLLPLIGSVTVFILSLIPHNMGYFVDSIFFLAFSLGCFLTYKSWDK